MRLPMIGFTGWVEAEKPITGEKFLQTFITATDVFEGENTSVRVGVTFTEADAKRAHTDEDRRAMLRTHLADALIRLAEAMTGDPSVLPQSPQVGRDMPAPDARERT